jgi:hypothetical protein
MKLQEIFDQLTAGELSQLSIGGGEAGVIAPSNYSRVVSHINLGLTSLYKRFPLKEERVGLQLVPGITTYNITSKFAVNSRSTREPIKYVLDTPAKPFKDDIHKIERVLTDLEWELPLNDASDMYSVYTPTATRLRIPEKIVAQGMDLPDELKTETLEIVYRANHPKINPEDLQPDEVEVQLPDSHVEALLYYVASRCHNPAGMANEFQIGSAYSAKYEQACQEIETFNLRVDQGSQNTRLAKGGWA